MTSVFGNVFRMSGGGSVWGNVFVLAQVETAGTAVAEFRSRSAVSQIRSRSVVGDFRSRTAVSRGKK